MFQKNIFSSRWIQTHQHAANQQWFERVSEKQIMWAQTYTMCLITFTTKVYFFLFFCKET